jgi:hypothetical protein
MTPKEAVTEAKSWIADVFAAENISDIRLEEIRFDDAKQHWLITIGFARPAPDTELSPIDRHSLSKLSRPPRLRTSYKVVRIDNLTGEVRAVENRETEVVE